MAAEEYFEDAEIEDLPRRTWFGAWLRGVIFGTVAFAAGAVGLSLSLPLPDHLPGVGKVRIVRAPVSPPVPAPTVPETPGAQQDTEAGPPDADAGAKTPDDEQVAAAPAPTPQVVQPAPDAAKPAEIETPTPQAQTTAQDPDAQAAADPADPSVPVPQVRTEPVVSDDGAADPGRLSTDPKVSAAPADLVAGVQRDTLAGATPSRDAAVARPALPSADVPGDQTTLQDTPARPAVTEQPRAGIPADQRATNAETDAPTAPAPDAAAPVPAETGDLALLSPTPDPQAQPGLPVPRIALSGPAQKVNARAFDAPGTAPLMAVVLSGLGTGGVEAEALALMTMPLTVAIGPGAESRALAEQARAFGHEVLAELPLATPDAAQKGRLSVDQTGQTLAAATVRLMADLDIAIGATGPDGAALLRDQARMKAIMQPLGEHGFLWVEPRIASGTGTRVAAKETQTTWAAGDRVIDRSASAEQIYQNLETAALQARRKGSVIVFVPASQEAMRGLVRWGLERGGQEVWFAPVSAVIARRAAQP